SRVPGKVPRFDCRHLSPGAVTEVVPRNRMPGSRGAPQLSRQPHGKRQAVCFSSSKSDDFIISRLSEEVRGAVEVASEELRSVSVRVDEAANATLPARGQDSR